jgi:hypothetical protein
MSDDTAGESIDVEVPTLAGLGAMMLREANHMGANSQGVMGHMSVTRPNFAGNGLVEGLTFQAVYEQAEVGLSQFLQDVVNGLNTLGNAALEISAAYGEADENGAVTIDTVRGTLPAGPIIPQAD